MTTRNVRPIEHLFQSPYSQFSRLVRPALTFRSVISAQLQGPVGISQAFEVFKTWYKMGTKWVRSLKRSVSPTGGSEPRAHSIFAIYPFCQLNYSIYDYSLCSL